MVKMWCTGAAVILMQVVLISARDCSNLDDISNCNDCIRCGGEWCKDSEMESQCTRSMTDSWCPRHKETLTIEEPSQEVGDLLSVKHSERTVFVGKQDMLLIHYKSAVELPINIKIVNTTQNDAFWTTPYTNCKNGHCKTSLEVMPLTDFCSENGRTSEYVNVQVKIEGLSEETTVKYKVPCACECAEKIEKMSRRCKGRGDYSCGHCFCQDGWTGPYCEKKVCKETGRGDNPCSHPLRGNVECSGNGECDSECQICKCYTDRVGSQYFDHKSQCADICLTVSECEECLRDPVLGKCIHCGFPLIYREFNDTIVEERDYLNRTVWIKCNETLLGEYYIEYFAMRDERGDIYFMIPPSDTTAGAIGGGGGVNITVPIVLGLLAVVAAGAMVAGYVMWKNRLPPVPLADPMYTNIDAEDSTGENPLYKPPTSSFKNPTYGKW